MDFSLRGVFRVELFSTLVLGSFGDRSPEAVQQARVLCLLCEAAHTLWLRLNRPETAPMRLSYLCLCL